MAPATSQTTIIPHSQEPLVTRTYPSASELDAIVERAAAAQAQWKLVPLKERVAIGRKFIVKQAICASLLLTEMALYLGGVPQTERRDPLGAYSANGTVCTTPLPPRHRPLMQEYQTCETIGGGSQRLP